MLCNFGLNIPDLHPITPEAVRAVVRCKPSPQRPVASAVWTSDEYTIYQLNAKCQDFVTRYYARSLLTPDDGNMIDVNRRLFKLAFSVRATCGMCPTGLIGTEPMFDARFSSRGTYI